MRTSPVAGTDGPGLLGHPAPIREPLPSLAGSAQVGLPGLSGPEGVGLLAFFAVGLLGGAHCLGMCGPLVTTYADRMPEGKDRPGSSVTPFVVRQHLLFNAGRTVGYAAVGALLGLVGAAAFGAADVAAVGDGLRAAVGLAVGLAILVVGLGYLAGGAGGGPGHLTGLPVVGTAFARVHGALTAHVDRLAAGPGIVALGSIHALLPCPLLYPAYLYAVATGSALWGGASLLALGLGTFPTVLAYGTAIGSLSPDTRARLHRALGAAFVVMATIPLLNALSALGIPVPRPPLPMPGAPYGWVVP